MPKQTNTENSSDNAYESVKKLTLNGCIHRVLPPNDARRPTLKMYYCIISSLIRSADVLVINFYHEGLYDSLDGE